MQILQVTYSSKGVYFCKVQYTRLKIGVVPSRKATLYVRGIVSPPVNTYGVAGEPSTITCRIGGDKPDAVRLISHIILTIKNKHY